MEPCDALHIVTTDEAAAIGALAPEVVFDGIWSEEIAQRVRQGILNLVDVELSRA